MQSCKNVQFIESYLQFFIIVVFLHSFQTFLLLHVKQFALHFMNLLWQHVAMKVLADAYIVVVTQSHTSTLGLACMRCNWFH